MKDFFLEVNAFEDRKGLIDHYEKLSLHDKRTRFMGSPNSNAIKEYIDGINFTQSPVFGVYLWTSGTKSLVGVAHLTINDTKKVTEIALSVDSEHRGKGCGSALMNHAIKCTKEFGYSKLKVVCLFENEAMVKLARKSGFVMKLTKQGSYKGSLIIK